MKKNIKRNPVLLAGLAACCLWATGCASGPKFTEYRASLAPPVEGLGRVWFYRTTAFGAGVQPAVKLDGRKVGNAVPRGYFFADTQPGVHEVTATTEWKHKTSVSVSTNRESYVKLNMAPGFFVGHVIPTEVPQQKALKEMQNLNFADNRRGN